MKKKGFLSPIEKRLGKRILKDGLIAFAIGFPPCWFMFHEVPWIAWFITSFAVMAVMFSTILHWRFRRFRLTVKFTKKNNNSW